VAGSGTKYLLILGSGGFLGRTIMNTLPSKSLMESRILISQPSQTRSNKRFILLDSNLEVERILDIKELKNKKNVMMSIVNCISSRNTNTTLDAWNANYLFPKSVLDSLLAYPELSLNWLQLESYWQYSKSTLPDPIYVESKVALGEYLSSLSYNKNLRFEKIVLPHLVGPIDNIHRLIPKLFLKLLKGEECLIANPNSIFSITDVRDVAESIFRYLTLGSSHNSGMTYLHPFHAQSLSNLLEIFVSLFELESKMKFIEKSADLNPLLLIEHQPAFLPENRAALRSLEKTMTDTANWLIQSQKIAKI
jgi:nucleoside-diphosphate-sugar epimerase